MDFGRYLWFTQRLTGEEYRDLHARELNMKVPKDGRFHATHLDDFQDLGAARKFPFGEVLKDSPVRETVLSRAKKSIDELVQEWQTWHLTELEPLCTYSLKSQFGERLYAQQREKKLVASFLVAGRARAGAAMIQKGDTVVLHEGTSAAYVGLAIAAHRLQATIVTSNPVLIREYQDNPAFSDQFRQNSRFVSIGGDLGQCGVCGKATPQQYSDAIQTDPKATVVIVSVNGLLPEDGPRFLFGNQDGVRKAIIDAALRGQHRVRLLVFVMDYTKQQTRDVERRYGHPLFTASDWKALLSDYGEQIRIVTAPPPPLRAAMTSETDRDIPSRRIELMKGPEPLDTPQVHEYDAVAKKFDKLVAAAKGGHREPRYLEAIEQLIPQNQIAFRVAKSYEDVDEGLFCRELARMLPDPERAADLTVIRKRRQGETTVVLKGAPDVLGDLHHRLQFVHDAPPCDALVKFLSSTGVVEAQIVHDWQSHAFDFRGLPVPKQPTAV